MYRFHCRVVPAEIDPVSFLVLANFGNSSHVVDATVFQSVPPEATVLIRSVGFESATTTIG
jgi:hypothetical protein